MPPKPKIPDLLAQIEQLEKSSATLSIERDEARKARDALEEEKKGLLSAKEADEKGSEAAKGELQRELEESKVEHQRQLDELNKQLEKLERSAEQRAEKLEKAEEKIRSLAAALSDRDAELASAKQEISRLSSALEEERVRAADLGSSLSLLDRTLREQLSSSARSLGVAVPEPLPILSPPPQRRPSATKTTAAASTSQSSSKILSRNCLRKAEKYQTLSKTSSAANGDAPSPTSKEHLRPLTQYVVNIVLGNQQRFEQLVRRHCSEQNAHDRTREVLAQAQNRLYEIEVKPIDLHLATGAATTRIGSNPEHIQAEAVHQAQMRRMNEEMGEYHRARRIQTHGDEQSETHRSAREAYNQDCDRERKRRLMNIPISPRMMAQIYAGMRMTRGGDEGGGGAGQAQVSTGEYQHLFRTDHDSHTRVVDGKMVYRVFSDGGDTSLLMDEDGNEVRISEGPSGRPSLVVLRSASMVPPADQTPSAAPLGTNVHRACLGPALPSQSSSPPLGSESTPPGDWREQPLTPSRNTNFPLPDSEYERIAARLGILSDSDNIMSPTVSE